MGDYASTTRQESRPADLRSGPPWRRVPSSKVRKIITRLLNEDSGGTLMGMPYTPHL